MVSGFAFFGIALKVARKIVLRILEKTYRCYDVPSPEATNFVLWFLLVKRLNIFDCVLLTALVPEGYQYKTFKV